MQTLAAQRKAYHSEADFQHAFAWEIHRQFPESSVRLEVPLSVKGRILHVDFLIQFPDRNIAIELKYKTCKLTMELEGETYNLAGHGAQVIGRYDFIKDITRLEDITAKCDNCEGYAILLTNDSAYWKKRNKRADGKVDEAFSLTDKRILSGRLDWAENASDGTKKNREKGHQLLGTYNLDWIHYSDATKESHGQFRYLAVHVPKRT